MGVLPTLEGAFYALIAVSYLSMMMNLPAALDRVVAYLGGPSYFIYLNHAFMILVIYNFAMRHGHNPSTFSNTIWFSLFLYPPAVIVGSIATHHLIEKLLVSLRRSYIKKN